MQKKIGRREFVKGTLGVLGGVAVGLSSSRVASAGRITEPKFRPRLATLTVDSLSITPGSVWPLESASGIIAARDEITFDSKEVDRLIFIESGVSLPPSNTEGIWNGDPSVQTDFSP